jgi:hypothetical protein
MFDFEKEKEKEASALGFKSMRKNLRTLDQVGRTSKKIDASRKALAPGKRISKTGKVYWETRKNRSDAVGSSI